MSPPKATCETCGEPYSMPPTMRAALCSNGFHCCRDCTWRNGQVVKSCGRTPREHVDFREFSESP